MDTFDELAQKWFSSAASRPDADVPQSPFRRVIMFVDNAGQLESSLLLKCSCLEHHEADFRITSGCGLLLYFPYCC